VLAAVVRVRVGSAAERRVEDHARDLPPLAHARA
jgi:hypothetical protein